MGPFEKIVDQIWGVFNFWGRKTWTLGSGTPKRDMNTEILVFSEKLIGNAGFGHNREQGGEAVILCWHKLEDHPRTN